MLGPSGFVWMEPRPCLGTAPRCPLYCLASHTFPAASCRCWPALREQPVHGWPPHCQPLRCQPGLPALPHGQPDVALMCRMSFSTLADGESEQDGAWQQQNAHGGSQGWPPPCAGLLRMGRRWKERSCEDACSCSVHMSEEPWCPAAVIAAVLL